MTLAVRGIFWVLAYLGVVLAPLVFALVGASQPDHSFVTNFSVALGFVGLAMMGMEFVLVARFETIAAPFGEDALLQFHRQIGYVGLAFVLIHVARSAGWRRGSRCSRRSRARSGVRGCASPPSGGIAHTHRARGRRRGDRPRPHPRRRRACELARQAGAVGPHDGRLRPARRLGAVKPSPISELEPGIPVYVDGPHGVFSIDQSEGHGFGLIAGGDWDGIAFRDVIDELAGRMNLTAVHRARTPPAPQLLTDFPINRLAGRPTARRSRPLRPRARAGCCTSGRRASRCGGAP